MEMLRSILNVLWMLLLILLIITLLAVLFTVILHVSVTYISNMIQIQRLPQPVWDQLKSDIRRGRHERNINLKIGNIYKVVNPTLDIKFNTVIKMTNPKIQQLYHGTDFAGIKGICESGFRLPHNTAYNMFGPGIYLAEVPQKSSDYTDDNGYIIICDVAVGRIKKIRNAILDPSKDLKKSYLFGLVKREYDTVHAPAGTSTISDEHIVFDPDRIVPRYIIETTRC